MSQAIWDSIVPTITSGNQLATLLNNFKDAVVSGLSGATRPSQLQAGGTWVDTSADASGIWKFRLYDGSQDVEVFTINKTDEIVALHEAMFLLKKGAIARLIIPSHLAYGISGDGDRIIGQHSLVMHIELLNTKSITKQ